MIPLGQEELALAAKNGQTFVVYNGALSASSLPKRDSNSRVRGGVERNKQKL